MKELIEKLEGARDYNEYWDSGKQCCIVPISVINEAIQALTSVKSESAEDKKANVTLWEMAEEITKLQRKAKELDTSNVMWNYLEEDWFDWLEEKFSLLANAEKKQESKEINCYAVYIQKKPYKALLSIQTSPFFKIIYKDKEITTDELCGILMELQNDEDKKQHAIGFAEFCQVNKKFKTLDELHNEYLTNHSI